MTAPVAGLVRRARSSQLAIGEQHAAFSALVARFERMAFATALAACEDAESARDACQEAFLVAWRKLSELEDPDAFGGWLKRLVRTQCARARRRDRETTERTEAPIDAVAIVARREVQRKLRHAVAELPENEREAVALFYFLGEPLGVVAKALGITEGHAGKTLYNARLHLRRCLPRSLAEEFLAGRPTSAFAARVQAGVFDELTGEYRFAERPDHVVLIRREADRLVGYAGGQRSVLASRDADSLLSTAFDGEGRFRRDVRGRVSHFVYYEFGRRLGVARKLAPEEARR